MSYTKLAEVVLYRLLETLPLLSPSAQVGVLVFILLVLILAGYGSYYVLFLGGSVFGRRKKPPGTDYHQGILLCGVIARDLAYGAYKVKHGDAGRTLNLTRGALLAGIVRIVGKKGNQAIRACILVRRPREDYLIIDQADGYSAEACENLQLSIRDTIAGEAYESLKARYCPDIEKDPGYKNHPKRRRNYRSVFCIPIKCGNKIYGILNMDAIPKNAFNESEIKALEAFADLAALSYALERSIENEEDDSVSRGERGQDDEGGDEGR